MQYGAPEGVNANTHFPPNPFSTHSNPYRPPEQQQLSYPPVVPGAQQHQPYYGHLAPTAQPSQHHPPTGLHQPQQYGQQPQPQQQQPPVASPSPARDGPGAPPPELNSPSLSQYGNIANEERQEGDGNGDGDDDADETAQADQGDGPEPVFHLPPPPEGQYPSEEALEEAVHSWSLEHGYELVRRASKKNAKGILYKRYMHCSRHGKAANTSKLTDQTRQRFNRKSARINCPMSIAVVSTDPMNPQGEWQVRHRKTHHNHGPLDALALTGHRRRARAGGIEQAVDGLLAIGTPTAQVLQFLQRTNPHGLFTRTDVANMKLKFQKFGTCLIKQDTSAHGRPCDTCRSRKIKCNQRRPTCGSCIDAGKTCQYDYPDPAEEEAARAANPDADGATDGPTASSGEPGQEENQTAGRTRTRGGISEFQQRAQRAEEILANLQAFKTQHVAPVRLDLQSSAIEILAASSCGNGDSYKNIPVLKSADDWPSFRDMMTEAAMKENTFEVLMAEKTEPTAPPSDCKIEDWNEYIKKLAIFNRRNAALTGTLYGKLAPTFRNRVQHLKNAADIWAVLEDVCLPQGSETGFKLYMELHNITQANSADLKDYIHRLETAYVAFNRLSKHLSTQLDPQNSRPAPTFSSSINSHYSGPFSAHSATHPASRQPPAPNVFTEEMLCLLFLRNLAPDFKRWVDSLCATNNVAGFGTGPRLGFLDLTRRAVDHEVGMRGGR